MSVLAAISLAVFLVMTAWFLGLFGKSDTSSFEPGEVSARGGVALKKNSLASKRKQRTEALISTKEDRMHSLRSKARARYTELYGSS